MNVLGVFDSGNKAADAIHVIRRDRLGDVEVYGPAPDHAVDQALEVEVSRVRVFVLIGGLLGCLAGFALPIYTVLDWPLITGGQPLISIPPFVVIAFEFTILFAAIAGGDGVSRVVPPASSRQRRRARSAVQQRSVRRGGHVRCGERKRGHNLPRTGRR